MNKYPTLILDVEYHAPDWCKRMKLYRSCNRCWANGDGGLWCYMGCREGAR